MRVGFRLGRTTHKADRSDIADRWLSTSLQEKSHFWAIDTKGSISTFARHLEIVQKIRTYKTNLWLSERRTTHDDDDEDGHSHAGR